MVLGVLYTRSVLLSRGGGQEFKELLKSPREGAWHLMTFTHHPQPLAPQGREEPASPLPQRGGIVVALFGAPSSRGVTL